MATRTDRDQTWDRAGNLVKETSVVRDVTIETNASDLRDKAQQALAVNAAFLALSTPTNAQVLAQTQRLTRENNALIRLMLGLLDDTAGT